MITKNIGMLLLAIYLIIVGIVTLTGLGIGFITGALALVAGIFILMTTWNRGRDIVSAIASRRASRISW